MDMDHTRDPLPRMRRRKRFLDVTAWFDLGSLFVLLTDVPKA